MRFHVALFEGMTTFNGDTDQEPMGVVMENQRKSIGFTPNEILEVAKDNDPRFSAKRKEILILFDCEDGHGRNSLRSAFFVKHQILPQS